jgi:hypothetical protein
MLVRPGATCVSGSDVSDSGSIVDAVELHIVIAVEQARLGGGNRKDWQEEVVYI